MLNPEKSPETATPQPTQAKAETPQANESSLRELAKHFTLDEPSGETDDPAETPEAERKPAAEKVMPKTLNDVAERLGVEVKDLYDLAIPSDKLEGLTLGKLKDHMAEREDFTVRSLEFEENKRRREAEFIRAEQELQTLLAALPKDAIKPEVLNAAREKQAKHMQTERTRTIGVIPEWKDEKVREADIAEIKEHLSSYGFPDGYLSTVYDHRSLKLLRDFTKQSRQLQRALELVRERRPSGIGKGKPTGGNPTPKPKPRSREEQEVARMLGALRP